MSTLHMDKYINSSGILTSARKGFKLKEPSLIKIAIVTFFSSLPMLSFAVASDLTINVDKADYKALVYDKALYQSYFPGAIWSDGGDNLIFPELMAIGFQAKLANSPTGSAKGAVGGSMVIGTKLKSMVLAVQESDQEPMPKMAVLHWGQRRLLITLVPVSGGLLLLKITGLRWEKMLFQQPQQRVG